MTTNCTNLYDSAKETTHMNGSWPTRTLWQSVKEMICHTHSRDKYTYLHHGSDVE